MSSILTNTSAMIALQTLKGINHDLAQTQGEISTGKSIASAKDNSAVWAISKVMQADVSGFKAISASLSLGDSTVAVARQATESITSLLTQMKGKIVAAQESNVDRSKIQTDISALRDQVNSVVGAAQFNGLNLIKGFKSVDVLSSLNRASDGSVTAASISVARHDLSTTAGVYGTGSSLATNVTASASSVTNAGKTGTLTVGGTIAVGDVFNFTIGGTTVNFTATTTAINDVATGLRSAITTAGIANIAATGTGADVVVTSTSPFAATALSDSKTSSAGTLTLSTTSIAARAENLTFSTSASVAAGDSYRATIGGVNYDYVASANQSFTDVANGLKGVIDAAGLSTVATNVTTTSSGAVELQIDNSGSTSLSLAASGAADGTQTGGLAAMAGIDVSTQSGATAALANIETLLQTSIKGAADFGSVQGRIQTQNDFVSKLTDSLKAGIGSLVDANMEQASARLQALQVQQQLGVQSLSIANKAPRSLLALFR